MRHISSRANVRFSFPIPFRDTSVVFHERKEQEHARKIGADAIFADTPCEMQIPFVGRTMSLLHERFSYVSVTRYTSHVRIQSANARASQCVHACDTFRIFSRATFPDRSGVAPAIGYASANVREKERGQLAKLIISAVF